MQKISSDLIKVGIVDDNKATVASLQEVLSYAQKIKVVLTARSGAELFEKLKYTDAESLPDIIVTDVNMPGMSGIEVVRQGKALYPSIRFMMLTVFDDEDTLFEAIKAGASGYLLKEERSAAIIHHIEQLMEDGSVPMSSRIARKTLDLLAQSSPAVSGHQVVQLEGLSAREKDVLYLLVDGLEYKEIAARLVISPHTVRKHIANVYEKLHISSKAQAIRLLQGNKQMAETGGRKRHKLLLVDDHQIILDSLAMMISTIGDCEITGKICDPTDVIPFLADNVVDLIISDISMPKMDGLLLAAQVKKQFPAIRMLMLTVSEAPEQVHRAHALGIEGYVLKKTNKEELTNAIRQIMSGESFYGQSIAAFV
jgi:DNA-binding NarL/FixJ family response regulator